MIKERYSDNAFLGVYGGVQYFVLFGGALVVRKWATHDTPKSTWADLINLLGNSMVLGDAPVTVESSYSLTAGPGMLLHVGDMIHREELVDSDFLGTLSDLCETHICKYLTERERGRLLDRTDKAPGILADFNIGAIGAYGSELQEDLNSKGEETNEDMAKRIMNKLPSALMDNSISDPVSRLLHYIDKYMM